MEVLQPPPGLFLDSEAGHSEWLAVAKQLPSWVVEPDGARGSEGQQPGRVQHHRHMVPFPTDGSRPVRHDSEIGDGRVPVEVLHGIANQHDVVCEETHDPVEVVCGQALLKLRQDTAGAGLGDPR